MILGTFAGGQPPRTNYNQTDSQKADYLVGREAIADHIASKVNPHGVTAAQIGALGFKRTLTSADDMDDIKEDGIYVYSTGSLPKNAPFSNASTVMVFGSTSTSSQKVQIGFRYGGAGQGKFRVLYNGAWKEWAEFMGLIEDASNPGCYYRYTNGTQEWFNPPFDLSEEYRTTERYGGKPVYCKRFNYNFTETIGNASGVTTITIPHNISGFGGLVRCICKLPNQNYLIPYISASGGITTINEVTATDIKLRLSKMTWSSNLFRFEIYYTK